MTAFRRVIGEAKNAIADAAKSGVVRIPKADGSTRELYVDRPFLDEAIARAEQLELEGKVYSAEQWESDEVQDRILHAPFPQNPEMEINGQAPKAQIGRTLVADYKYMMAGNLYVRDFASWENNDNI